jgi:hypothetical protein
MKQITLLSLVMGLVLGLAACNKNENCTDCGGTLAQGYIFKTVTTDDLAQIDGLALIEGVDAGVCIRAKLTGQEMDVNTVKVVDDCCCQ